MIRALFVGLITVIALAAALLAAEGRNVPPLAEAPARADLVLIDKSDRKLTLFQEGEKIYETSIALAFALLADEPEEEDRSVLAGEFTIAARDDASKFYLALDLRAPTGQHAATPHLSIHGQPNLVPGAVTLPGDWTSGGVAVSNAAMRTIWRRVATGTKVVIRL